MSAVVSLNVTRLLLVVLLQSGLASAHSPGASFLSVRAGADGTVLLRWDLALADAHRAIGIDTDGNGVEPAEVARGEQALFAYALSRVAVSSRGQPCALRAKPPLQLASHRDGRHLALRLVARCAPVPEQLTLQLRWISDMDAGHRTLARVRLGEQSQSAVFKQGRETLHFAQTVEAIDHHERWVRWLAAFLLPALLGISLLLWLGPNKVFGRVRRMLR